MKKKLFLSCMILFFSVIYANLASAEWSATIYAEGQDLGGQYKSNVIIGVALEAKKISTPPAAPNFTCYMVLKSEPNWSSFAKDIRKEGETIYSWVIAINPHGNMGSPVDATSTISWDPSQFGEGNYELREGWDGTGEIVVPDMKTVTRFDVTGGNSEQYFLLFEYLRVCEGDFDRDNDVDGSDLAVFAADFGRTDCDTGEKCEGDFDRNNDVDRSDLSVFAADFGLTDFPE